MTIKRSILLAITMVMAVLSANIHAADCKDLVGIWRGQLGELTVELDLKPGNSIVEYNAPWGSPHGGLVGGAGFTCNIDEGVPTLWIWHQVGGNNGIWMIRAIVDGRLHNPNELTIKTFRFERWSGSSHSGSGTLYRHTT